MDTMQPHSEALFSPARKGEESLRTNIGGIQCGARGGQFGRDLKNRLDVVSFLSFRKYPKTTFKVLSQFLAIFLFIFMVHCERNKLRY